MELTTVKQLNMLGEKLKMLENIKFENCRVVKTRINDDEIHVTIAITIDNLLDVAPPTGDITKKELHRLFDYDPKMGLIYKTRRRGKGQVIPGQQAGSSQPNGTRTVMHKRKRYQVHRLVWFWHHGYLPSSDDKIIFMDGDKSNSLIENLSIIHKNDSFQSYPDWMIADG